MSLSDTEMRLYWAYQDLKTLLKLRHDYGIQILQAVEIWNRGRQVIHYFQEPDLDKVILKQIKFMEEIRNDNKL